MTMPMSTVDFKPFPLSHLPWLAKKEALKSMDTCELFALSTISTKSKISVKAITAKQPFSVVLSDSQTIMLRLTAPESLENFTMSKLTMGENGILQNTMIAQSSEGVSLHFKTGSYGGGVNWAKRLIKFITEVFNIKKIDLRFEDLKDKNAIELLDFAKEELKLRFNRIIIQSTTITNKFYKYVLDNCMDAEELSIFSKPSDDFKYDVEDFKPKKYVSISHCSWMTSQHLEKFFMECQEACLSRLEVTSQELNHFLQQWKQSNKMRKFELIIANIDFRQVIHGLGAVSARMQFIEHNETFMPIVSVEIPREDGYKANIMNIGDKLIIETEKST